MNHGKSNTCILYIFLFDHDVHSGVWRYIPCHQSREDIHYNKYTILLRCLRVRYKHHWTDIPRHLEEKRTFRLIEISGHEVHGRQIHWQELKDKSAETLRAHPRQGERWSVDRHGNPQHYLQESSGGSLEGLFLQDLAKKPAFLRQLLNIVLRESSFEYGGDTLRPRGDNLQERRDW